MLKRLVLPFPLVITESVLNKTANTEQLRQKAENDER